MNTSYMGTYQGGRSNRWLIYAQMRLQAVLVPSAEVPTTATIRGWDFNDGCSLDGIMAAMLRTGCQATSLGQAVDEINRMVRSAPPGPVCESARLQPAAQSCKSRSCLQFAMPRTLCS